VKTASPDAGTIIAALAKPPGVPGVVALYVFGGVAERRLHRESDVDVGVLLDRRRYPAVRDRFEARLDLMSEVAPRLSGRAADVVVLNDAPPVLVRRIVTEGQLVYCADPGAEHAFRRDILLRAADLEPFLRRTRRRKLEAIDR
jgi:predicted nucleotidyltransferase